MNASDVGSAARRPQQTAPDLERIFRRHKFKFLRTFLLGIAVTMAYFALATRYFESKAKMFVKLGRQSVTLDPTASTGQSISIRETQNQEVFAIEELLNSRTIAEKVVDQFGPDVILNEVADTGEEGEEGFSLNLGERLAVLNDVNLNPLRVYSARDKAVKTFHKNFGVLAGKKTNILSISYQSKSPQLSRNILEAVIKLTHDEHLRMHRIQGSQEFFVYQSDLLRKNLEKLEEDLRDLKSKTGLASLEPQRAIHLAMLGALREKLLLTNSNSAALISELAERKQKIKMTAKMIVLQQTTDQPQTVAQTLREKLYDLEVQEQQLSSRFTETHPRMVQVRKQIEEARSIAEDEDNRPTVTQGVNPNYQAGEIAISEREAQLISLTSQAKAIKIDIAAAESKLEGINQSEVFIRKLEREIALANANYLTYSGNLEQARIDQEIEAAKISSLNVIQEPTFMKTPVSPKPAMTLGIGLLLSAILGMVVAVRAEKKRLQTSHASTLPTVDRLPPSYPDDLNIDELNGKEEEPTTVNGKVKAKRVRVAAALPR